MVEKARWHPWPGGPCGGGVLALFAPRNDNDGREVAYDITDASAVDVALLPIRKNPCRLGDRRRPCDSNPGRRPRRRPRRRAVVLRTRRPPSTSGCSWRRSLPATPRRACPRASGAVGADPRQRTTRRRRRLRRRQRRMTVLSRCPQRWTARSSTVRPPDECPPTTILLKSSRLDGQRRRAG
jgi:hypothetical protein